MTPCIKKITILVIVLMISIVALTTFVFYLFAKQQNPPLEKCSMPKKEFEEIKMVE